MVMRACRAGLPSLILCPPNISGPHSLFLSGLVDALRAGKFAILEGGRTPCSLVDIGNLAHAIELSLERGIADGKRMFITDDESIEWGEVIARLVPLAELGTPVPSITHEELLRLSRSNDTPHISIARSLKHLVSSDVRQAMRKDPLWAKLDQMLRSSVAQLGHAAEDRLRLSIAGPLAVPKVISDCQYDVRLCSQQLRDVRHTSDSAKRELGYRTLYAFSKSMDAFIASYRIQHGMDTGNWDILRLLI